MLKDTIVTTLTAVGKLPDLFRSARSDSLIEYTRVTRAEPITLLDSSVLHLPYIGDVMQSLTAIYAGYYLQAAAISVNVGKVDVIRMLEKINPARSPAENAGMFIGDVMLDDNDAFSVEAFKDRLPFYSAEAKPTPDELPKRFTLGRNTTTQATAVANLSVGMLLEVNVESEGNHATIPVSVRLIASAIANDTLLHMLAYAEKNNSVKERYHAWRSGQLEFIKDNIFCQDLIDAHRKAMIKDSSGTYQAIRDRSKNNKLAAILSGQPSVATASNIVVLTAATAAALEGQIGGRLNTYATRQRIFEATYMMLMVVVDTQWEQVTIYHRGISTPTTLSVKELKNANKGSGPDVAEILKAYQLGTSPSF